MKGIKECLTFMLENEGAWIINELDDMIMYQNEKFYISRKGNDLAGEIEMILHFIGIHEWAKYEKTVDFLTAYKDCLENGNSYKRVGGINECIMKRMVGAVHVINDKCKSTNLSGHEWVKI